MFFFLQVLQAHCEGPAGRGPTASCKHIVAVLLSLVKFAQEGNLQVQLGCTDRLQTFKRPAKSHQGSPVRAESLPFRKGTDYDWEHDPRPKKYRSWSTEDHMYSAATNFCYESGLDLNIRYMYPDAYHVDLHAAELHHDYLKDPLVVT